MFNKESRKPNRRNDVESLPDGMVSRLSNEAITSISSLLSSYTENTSVSPASYMLSIAALSSITKGMDNAAFGLGEDAKSDLEQMLQAWNFAKGSAFRFERGLCCDFKCGILHQQVGTRYQFALEKQNRIANNYVKTIVSSLQSYNQDATSYLKNELGFKMDAPNPGLTEDGVITYGAFKMKDNVFSGLDVAKNTFRFKEGRLLIDTYAFGSEYDPLLVTYYKGKEYIAFEFQIAMTTMLIVLPDEGIDINEIDLASAIREFDSGKTNVKAMGYVPFFHIRTDSINLTERLTRKLTGEETPYSELLDDSSPKDLKFKDILQSNDFEFNQFGVEGESITACAAAVMAGPMRPQKPILIQVDRPFYAVSRLDGFPLFINKVFSPNKMSQSPRR